MRFCALQERFERHSAFDLPPPTLRTDRWRNLRTGLLVDGDA